MESCHVLFSLLRFQSCSRIVRCVSSMVQPPTLRVIWKRRSLNAEEALSNIQVTTDCCELGRMPFWTQSYFFSKVMRHSVSWLRRLLSKCVTSSAKDNMMWSGLAGFCGVWMKVELYLGKSLLMEWPKVHINQVIESLLKGSIRHDSCIRGHEEEIQRGFR